MLISWIFLIISLPNLHGLYCYSNGLFHFSRQEFHWENISNFFNHPIISNTSSCHVRLTIDYHTKINRYVTIEFHPDEHFSSTNIEFGSTIDFRPNDIQTIVSYLDYRCSSGNLCDRDFLKTWPKELLNSNNNTLHQNFLSAWKNREQCQEKIRTNYCESYLCFQIYNELKNLSYGKIRCEDRLSTNPVNIYIKTKSGNIHQEYQCRKNQCTGEIFYNSLIPTNSTGKFRNQNQLNQLILQRAMIIIGILIVIGLIAYLIQCRKYKQGYRLTRHV